MKLLIYTKNKNKELQDLHSEIHTMDNVVFIQLEGKTIYDKEYQETIYKKLEDVMMSCSYSDDGTPVLRGADNILEALKLAQKVK